MMAFFSSKKRPLLLLAAAAILFGGGFYFLQNRGPKLLTGVEVSYPAGWQEQALNDAERAVGILLRLSRTSPDAAVFVRTIVGVLEDGFQIQTLEDEVSRSLGASLKGFKLVSQEVVSIGSLEAVEVRYTQKDEGDNKLYEALMVVIPTPQQTFFLTFRSLEKDFSQVESEAKELKAGLGDYIIAKRDL